MFSTSGNLVQKTHNLGFAAGLARRISQHLMAMPFEDIQEIPLPGITLCDSSDDTFFNPMFNFSDSSAGAKRITTEDLPTFYNYLKKFDFSYSLSVSNVSFGDGDEIKDVGIIITWKESGKDLLYKTNVYIPSL
jgi:hypothetical protein